MPRSKSILKRQSQNERRRLRNKSVRSKLKTLERRFGSTTEAGAAPGELRTLQSDLDKAAASGAIHPNKAARKKSRLARGLAKRG